MKRTPIIIFGLVLIAVTIAGWYYYSRPKGTVAPSDDQRTATITDLKISLRFPASWGEAAVISSPRVQTGQAKYLDFSIVKVNIPIFSFPSQDFTAGRSGTTAEVLVARKQTDIETCADLERALSLASGSIGCQKLVAANKQPFFIFKDEKFGSVAAEGLYFTGLADFPLLGAEGPESDLELIKQILSSIDSL